MKYLLTVLAMAFSLVFYTFNTFATKDEIRESVISRLDRIEAKLDRAIEKRN